VREGGADRGRERDHRLAERDHVEGFHDSGARIAVG
jgi:hypothetical protein